ncbi:hypothetical protein [Selenomonas ruminis]|uniref:Uncharacterized protein n=1 Tax=Selenomonas ruminis TaxID=2593411 RepID=A0A5D6W2U6_9FIRM|nr:hypothetical protein [Selenomonas sp. mPRGC5]TYZ22236.1 hypothetical protein FZ040_08415 [Selenomonas sp. mPRGC5]
MRRIIGLALTVLLLWAAQVSAAERVPLRVAQLPLKIESYMVPSQNVRDSLEKQVDRSLHVPLNGTLKAVEYIPERECLKAWEQITAAAGKRVKAKDIVKPLAEKLQADLVVLPILTGYEQYTRMSFRWDRGLLLHSYAAVQIVGYDRQSDEVFRKGTSRRFDDEYSAAGEVSQLAREAMDDALRDAAIHDRVWKWKTNVK